MKQLIAAAMAATVLAAGCDSTEPSPGATPGTQSTAPATTVVEEAAGLPGPAVTTTAGEAIGTPTATTTTTAAPTASLPDVDQELSEFDDLGGLLDELDELFADL